MPPVAEPGSARLTDVELHELDATAQASTVRCGEVSATELVQHHLDRVARLDPGLGAFITVTPDRALAEAASVDRDRAAGRDLPVLAGVPTAIKDLTEVAGVRTTYGSALWRDHVPTTDAPLTRRLRRAGLVSLGQTNTPELGLSSYTDNDVVGPARNPWDRLRVAGGSTGGGAAAVAAGLVPVAPGSDGAGSLRIPASCCGIVGFKPSRGLVDRGERIAPDDPVTDGPLGRSLRDVAALLDILAERPPASRFADVIERDPPRLRVARWHRPHVPGVEASLESIEAWELASSVLDELGHEVVDVETPFGPDVGIHHDRLWAHALAIESTFSEDELALLRPVTGYWLELGRAVTAAQAEESRVVVAAAVRSASTQLAAFDVWLTPTLALPPPRVKWFDVDPAEAHRRELLFTPYAAVHNLAGMPSISLPVHWTAATGRRATLPIGVMLAAAHGRDALLLRLSAQVERRLLDR